MSKKTSFEQVEEFHAIFDPRKPKQPTPFSEQEAIYRAGFKAEELVELIAATSNGQKEQLHQAVQKLHEAIDQAEQKMLKKEHWGQQPLIEQVDALTDILYFTYGSFSLLGVDPTNIFDIVHQANMGKLFPDHKPHYHPVTNKVLKPENWAKDFAPEPRIKQEITKQIAQAQQKNIEKKELVSD